MENQHFFKGKSTITGPCSIGMLNYQRVYPRFSLNSKITFRKWLRYFSVLLLGPFISCFLFTDISAKELFMLIIPCTWGAQTLRLLEIRTIKTQHRSRRNLGQWVVETPVFCHGLFPVSFYHFIALRQSLQFHAETNRNSR